jgi:hypothetical protein
MLCCSIRTLVATRYGEKLCISNTRKPNENVPPNPPSRSARSRSSPPDFRRRMRARSRQRSLVQEAARDAKGRLERERRRLLCETLPAEVDVAGGCSCGAIRYTLLEAPREVLLCHCADCRRAAGAHSVAWLVQPLRSVEFKRGTPAWRESSPGVTRVFCRGCGTQLSYRNEASDYVAVTLGSLDDPSAFSPTRTAFEEHKLGWASPI